MYWSIIQYFWNVQYVPDTILPIGQDKAHIFHRAYGLVGDGTEITTLDSQGVAARPVASALPGSLLEMHG